MAFLAVGFVLEKTGDHAEGSGEGLSQTARAAYQRISSLGYRKRDVRYTALVLLDDKPDSKHDPPEIADNGCRRRLYLARVITALQAQGAVAIVLDFYFEAKCPEEDKELSEAITTAAADIPVVVGQKSEDVGSKRRREPGSVSLEINDSDLVPEPPQIFPEPRGATYGLITLAADTRRIPLRWAIAASGRDSTHLTERHVQDSLSFAAAAAHKRSLLNDSQLNDYLSRGAWPLTSFITEDKFPKQAGLDLLCWGQDPRNWTRCTFQPDPNSIFKGYVAVVGFGDNDKGLDMHDSVLGHTSGVILQANYIESLLDGAFIRQASWPLQIVLSFLCFAAVEISFEFSPNIWRALAVATLVVLLFYAISDVAMVQFGYYLELWIPGALALGLKVISSLQGWAKEKVAQESGVPPSAP